MALLRWPSWVGVVAGDLAGQRRFYRDVLGLREVEAGDGWIGFDLDGNWFELLAVSERPQYERPRYQVGFEVEDIETARAELIRRGVKPISEIEGSEATSRWAYFRDPEGNVFEITQRPTP
jgi:catechol 2,3-dioxygenase-like lactoylglutathione lyase family enzyme